MLLGAALQITNTYGDAFLGSFAKIPEFADSFGVKHSVILLSISQILPETLRNQTCHAHQYVRLGIPIRTVWLW